MSVLLASAMLALPLAACSPARARQVHQDIATPMVPAPPSANRTPPAREESELDRTIRVQLDKSFDDEPLLKDRDITFSVDGGDVTLTGSVRSETERRKANEVAMDVPGVRSVANVLRVSL